MVPGPFYQTPDLDAEDALIPLSALQHHLFCPRQCALIHVEGLWAEDGATAAGRILHETVDAGGAETRPGIRVTRGVALRSLTLDVAGRADVAEWQGAPPRPVPVEYKRGKPKAHRADEVQLCAQGICLEEMLGVSVPSGALFYGKTRRRLVVRFDDALRTLTAATALAARANIAAGRTPPPVHTAACGKCSTQELCNPWHCKRRPRSGGGWPSRSRTDAVRRLLNTIYVTTEDAWLRKDGANIVVEVEGAERGRAPLHLLDGVVSFGRAGASPALLAACAESGTTVSYLTPEGRFLARVEGPRTGNVLLRRAQFRASDDQARATLIVRSIVAAKAANQRAVVRRGIRDHGASMLAEGLARLVEAERRLTDAAQRTMPASDVATLRGLEGEAASLYFGVLDELIRADEPSLRFKGRSRRPPLDPMNAVLSFLYAMLGHNCRSALEAHGLDPQVGFLHADRPGRASLALDLMEELRPVLADRLALSLVNRRQLGAGDFVFEDTGGVRLTDEARKRVLVAWQDRKRDEVRHPFLGEAVALGLVASIRAQLLARHLRADLDGYPPFVWR